MCDDSTSQCCAPIKVITDNSYTERCKNKIYKGYHCKDHYDKAVQLYKNYKDICNKAYKLYPENVQTNTENIREDIQYLFKCHSWYVKAYNARMEHKNYAFTPENSNQGHEYQFEWIENKLNICDTKLKNLYNRIMIEEKENKNKEIKSSKEKKKVLENEEIKNMINQVNDFKKKKKKEEKEVKKLIELYIKENDNKYENDMKLAQQLTLDFLSSMDDIELPGYGNEEKKIDMNNLYNFHIQAAIFEIARKLDQHKYFHDTYIPEKSNCKCCRFLPIEIKLFCNCIVKYKNITEHFYKFIELAKEDAIPLMNMICTIVERNTKKITLLMNDFIKLYKVYGIELLWMKVSFIYDGERLVLTDEFEKPEHITSEDYKFRRLKREQKLQKWKEEVSLD